MYFCFNRNFVFDFYNVFAVVLMNLSMMLNSILQKKKKKLRKKTTIRTCALVWKSKAIAVRTMISKIF